MNVGYGWMFGPPAGGPPQIGVIFNGQGSGPEVRTFDPPGRYRIGLFINAQNLTNNPITPATAAP